MALSYRFFTLNGGRGCKSISAIHSNRRRRLCRRAVRQLVRIGGDCPDSGRLNI